MPYGKMQQKDNLGYTIYKDMIPSIAMYSNPGCFLCSFPSYQVLRVGLGRSTIIDFVDSSGTPSGA